MLDLLAAISSVDPPALLAWLILAFAASGYPLGIMLGSSCSPCCGQPCTLCTEGELPETLTVTFDGLQDQTPGPDLCLLAFSAPYGGGAAGKVTAPGGDPATDKGAISSVSLTSGGSGYAKLGRVAPTITATGGSGTGAAFSVGTTSTKDANGIPSWSVTGVTLTGTPTGYVDGDQITFSVAAGDTEEQAAAATIQTTRTAPTLTAAVSGGSGAAFSVTTAANGSTPQTWSVTGVTVTNGGTGYPATGSVTFTKATGDTEAEPASATFYSGRVAPTVTVAVGGSGSGAVLSGNLSSSTDYYGKTYWYISSVSVTNAGSGYSEYDELTATVTDGVSGEYSYFYAFVSVDGGGAVTGVTLYGGGEYFKSNGIIESVEINYLGGGSYYRDDGVITGVTVDAGGTYYREDASVAPYVATVTVGVTQTAPSAGTGATLTATVESSTSSANFGKITGVTITSGGTNYLAWEWRNTKCCGDYYNGLSVVVKRLNYGDGNPCRYEHRMCGVGNIRNNVGRVEVFYNGPTTPPYVALQSEIPPDGGNSSSICNTTFTASDNVTNCSTWSGVSFSASGGATASVSAGGEYDATFKNPGGGACHICCKGDEVPPQEITVSVSGASGSGYFVSNATNAELNYSWDTLDGDWVLSRGVGLSWYLDPPLVVQDGVAANPPPLSVSIEPCSSQTSTGFGEDGFGCDFCHKKCRVVFGFTGFEQRFCLGSDPNHCGGCSDTPRCSPAGASFTMCTTRYLEAIGEFLWVRNRLGFPHQANPNPPPVAGTIIADNDCTDYGEPPEWTKYPFRLEVDPVTGIGTGNYVYDYAWPRPGNRCPMNVTIS